MKVFLLFLLKEASYAFAPAPVCVCVRVCV